MYAVTVKKFLATMTSLTVIPLSDNSCKVHTSLLHTHGSDQGKTPIQHISHKP